MKKRASSWTLASSVFAAIVASLCCIGPVIALSLGLGSCAVGSFFAESRPLFLGLTFVLLGLAWFMAYRRPKSDCNDAICARRPGKALRIALWTGTVIAILAAAYPWLARSPQEITPVVTTASGEKFSVSIPSMDCAACARGIEASLRETPGILSAHVNHEVKTANIVFDPVITTRGQVLARIDATGFPADRNP